MTQKTERQWLQILEKTNKCPEIPWFITKRCLHKQMDKYAQLSEILEKKKGGEKDHKKTYECSDSQKKKELHI